MDASILEDPGVSAQIVNTVEQCIDYYTYGLQQEIFRYFFPSLFLNKITEWQRLDGGNFSVGASSLEEVSFLWKDGGTLEVDLDSSLGGFSLGLFVLDLALQDFLLALTGSDVLNADMDTLFDNSSIDQLVHTNTNGTLGNIENNSGSAVVSLVGHTLVDGRIGKDVHIVTNLHFSQVLRKVDRSVTTELLGKHVARTRPYTKGVRHLVSTNRI